MKALLLATALTAASLAPAAAAETPLERALRAPQPNAGVAPLILAQYDRRRPTCANDGKELPRGSMVCYEGKLMQCGPRGAWEDTGKPC